jgi:synaptic vesicle membrane protein VAT-1
MVHFGASSSYGGAKDGLFGLRKWLTLLPGYLSRPLVDPGQLTPANRTAAS